MTIDKQFARFFPISLVIMGSVFLLSYLYSIEHVDYYLPYAIIPLSVVLLSCGIFLSYRIISYEHVYLFIYALYILTLVLFLIRSVRFVSLSGTDNLFEYSAARETASLGYWPIELHEENPNYVSLYISVFPAIFSIITGIELIIIFKYVIYIIVSIIPMLVFLVNYKIFDNVKTASIAAIIYCESVVFFYHLTQLNRLLISIIFLLLFLYIIFKHDRNNVKKFNFLSLILLFAIIAGHYSTAYFSNILLLSLILCLYLFRFRTRAQIMIISKYINSKLVIFYSILLFSWLSFLGSWLFRKHIRAAKNVVLSIFGIRPRTYHWSTRFIYESPMGPLYTLWSDFIIVLSIVGLLYFFLEYLWFKKYKNTKTVLWAFGAFTFASLSALWYLIPGISNSAPLTRVYGISSMLLYSFVAYVLIKVDNRVKGFLLIFLTLNLSMNLMLFSQGEDMARLLYFPSYSIAPEKRVKEIYNTQEGYFTSLWMKKHVNSIEIISGDYRGILEIARAHFKSIDVSYPHFDQGSNYLLLHHFFSRYGLWMKVYKVARGGRSAIFINQSIPQANIVYNNDYFMLLQRIL